MQSAYRKKLHGDEDQACKYVRCDGGEPGRGAGARPRGNQSGPQALVDDVVVDRQLVILNAVALTTSSFIRGNPSPSARLYATPLPRAWPSNTALITLELVLTMNRGTANRRIRWTRVPVTVRTTIWIYTSRKRPRRHVPTRIRT